VLLSLENLSSRSPWRRRDIVLKFDVRLQLLSSEIRIVFASERETLFYREFQARSMSSWTFPVSTVTVSVTNAWTNSAHSPLFRTIISCVLFFLSLLPPLSNKVNISFAKEDLVALHRSQKFPHIAMERHPSLPNRRLSFSSMGREHNASSLDFHAAGPIRVIITFLRALGADVSLSTPQRLTRSSPLRYRRFDHSSP